MYEAGLAVSVISYGIDAIKKITKLIPDTTLNTYDFITIIGPILLLVDN